jgi:tetratricopeptide (TPR) repeat protein
MRSLPTIALLFSLLVPAIPPAAAADGPVEEARIRFQRGVQLFHEGSFEAALAEFRKAYQVAPSYRLLYNIGQVHYELHDYVGALKSFRQYLGDGGAEIPVDRRVTVETEIRKLEGLVAYLDLTARPAGADILVDDVAVGIAPLGGPVLVNAGQRRVTATKAGRAAPIRNVTVAGGERVRVVLDVPDAPPLASARPLAPGSSGRPREQDWQQVGVWIGVATTGALALTAGGFAFAAQQARRNFDNELDSFPTYRERVEYFRSRMVTLATVTDVLAVSALVTGGITVYLALRRSDESDGRRPPPRKLALRLAPSGVAVAGGF